MFLSWPGVERVGDHRSEEWIHWCNLGGSRPGGISSGENNKSPVFLMFFWGVHRHLEWICWRGIPLKTPEMDQNGNFVENIIPNGGHLDAFLRFEDSFLDSDFVSRWWFLCLFWGGWSATPVSKNRAFRSSSQQLVNCASYWTRNPLHGATDLAICNPGGCCDPVHDVPSRNCLIAVFARKKNHWMLLIAIKSH